MANCGDCDNIWQLFDTSISGLARMISGDLGERPEIFGEGSLKST